VSVVIPWERSSRNLSASSSSSVTTIPPSPTGMFLFEKKLKQPMLPTVPHFFVPQVAPGAWAASSSTTSPWRSATASTASMSHANPP
jgi:hypothetical protein